MTDIPTIYSMFRRYRIKVHERRIDFEEVDKKGGYKELICSFNEMDEIRRALGVGMGDCDHCKAWDSINLNAKVDHNQEVISYDITQLSKKVEQCVKRLDYIQGEGGLKPMTVQDIYSWLRRLEKDHGEELDGLKSDIRGLKDEQDIHTQHLKAIDLQWNNFSKLVVDWMKTTGGDVETLKEEFGLMKFIECYARGRKTLDDLQDRKDETKQP